MVTASPLTGMALGITLGCVVICGLAGVIAYSMRKRKDSFNTSQVDQSLVCTTVSKQNLGLSIPDNIGMLIVFTIVFSIFPSPPPPANQEFTSH